MNHPVTEVEILAAQKRIEPYVLRTPVLTSDELNQLAGCELFFKCENLQHIGAFKARGAMNAVLRLSPEERANGVATHSSGNHAQALARAASILGIKAYIVMPRTAPEIKKRGVRSFGGEIFECEPTLAARESTLADVIQKTGAVEIHPFNNYDVIAGQATTALEFFHQTPDLDVLITPVGGGGLLSGAALAAHYFSKNTEVMAGEPEGADDTLRSVRSGRIEPSQSNTIADGLLTTLGNKTFPIIYEHVKTVITVSDNEITEAMRLVWEKLKVIVEPSGVVPFAAVLRAREQLKEKKAGVVFSGGNVDLDRAFKLFSE